MRIAFYAPMKPPDHPVPSGDRQMARLLMRALAAAGHEVTLASRLRAREPAGDPRRQQRLDRLGARLAARYVRRAAPPPDLWFTYHLYYKAADWIGPRVAAALGIPYVVAEASLAPKRAGGPWDHSHRAVLAALAQAAAIIPLNPHNAACLSDQAKLHPLAPFIDPAPFVAAKPERAGFPLDPATPWIVTAAMMRQDAKLESYRLLAAALGRIEGRRWSLLVIGDGPARAEVEAAFAGFAPGRVHFAGVMKPAALAAALAAGDLYAWPAINEAYGLSLLEAQAAGLPVVAGETGGVASIVAAGQSGLLTPVGDAVAFAAGLARLLDDAKLRREMGRQARAAVLTRHSLAAASAELDSLLRSLLR